MKLALLTLSILGIAANVFAGESETLHCQNGDIAKVGDAHYSITVSEDGLQFNPYEGSFTIDAGDITYANNTFNIKNVKTQLSVEGEASQILVNATLKLSNDDSKLVAKISINKAAYRTYQMTCVKQSQ